MARISSRLDTAARALQAFSQLAVVGGLRVEKFQAQERPHALVERLLVDDRRQLRLRVGLRFGVGVHGAYSEPTRRARVNLGFRLIDPAPARRRIGERR